MIIYTAISDGYDTIKPCFVPDASYKVFYIDAGPDAARKAKRPKILSHQYLDTEYSMWVDGSVRLNVLSMRKLVKEYLAHTDIAVMLHPERTCVYDEGAAVIQLKKDDPAVVRKQLQHYRFMQYPEHYGLAECGVILRRNTATIREFEREWWREIETWSKRDQISFPYVAHKLRLPVTYIPGRPFFTVEAHCR